MERMKAIKQIRKLHKKFCRAMGCFLITLVLLCAAGGNLFAKYYAGQKNKGVGVASSLYFSSNVLKKVASAAETGDYSTVFNKEGLNESGEYIIDVSIQNFANQLLYNDENLDITYNITFTLEEAPTDNTTYTVSYISGSESEEESHEISTKGCTFNNYTLKGGKQDYHSFRVTIKRPKNSLESSDYTSKRIKVVAKPVSPSFVANSEILGGFLCATSIAAGYSFQAGFDEGVSKDGYAGYPYTISYTPDVDQAAHTVKISWNPEQLELDKFSSYWPSDGVKTDSSNNWHYIEVLMDPYSNIHITFFRAAGFHTDNLAECVNAIDKDSSQGGSGN